MLSETETRKDLFIKRDLLISCIVPIFNEQAVIENFIRALHEKLLKLSIPFEILVIDDGSSD